MTADLGIALKASTLDDALRAMGLADREAGAIANVEEVIESAATRSGYRSRRVLLTAGGHKRPGARMLARVADRRNSPRPDESGDPDFAGWVALVPRLFGGYRIVATRPDGPPLSWPLDEANAARLGPYAFTFHRTFERRALGVRDLVTMAIGNDYRDLAIVLALGLLAALIGLLTPIATARLIDAAIPSGAAGRIGEIIGGLAVAGVSLIVLDVLRSIALLRVEGKTGISTQAAILDRIISAPAQFFRQFTSGDLSQRLAGVAAVQREITSSVVGIVIAALFVAANAALMAGYSASLTAASLGVVAATVSLSIAIGLARVRLGRRIEALDGRIGSLSFEYLTGIAKLRAGAAEARAFANWSGLYRERRGLVRSSAGLANFETVVMSFLQPAATVLVLFLAWQLSQSPAGTAARGALTTGTFIAFHAALFALLGGIHGIVGIALGILHLKPVWERAKPILQTLPESGGERRERHEPRGAIALRDVRFAYPGGEDVLHGVNLDIRPGEFVAIVGPSGSGKSTLIRLLLGFEAPRTGQVLFDGRDIAAVDLAHLRRRVGTVLQGGRLWSGDLYTNIVGAANLPVEAAWDAARAAGLAEDIEAMPMGMYTLASEGLSTLSGGQRQRVLIARALVGAPSILLLDEATSALDNVSQAIVLDGLAKLDATRIVIAHRLGSVRAADRVVVLERGRIVQEGGFEELAARPGLFADLLARQT
jgi:NHLM bacteriocin system ABC transporter ATP-binding protein